MLSTILSHNESATQDQSEEKKSNGYAQRESERRICTQCWNLSIILLFVPAATPGTILKLKKNHGIMMCYFVGNQG